MDFEVRKTSKGSRNTNGTFSGRPVAIEGTPDIFRTLLRRLKRNAPIKSWIAVVWTGSCIFKRDDFVVEKMRTP